MRKSLIDPVKGDLEIDTENFSNGEVVRRSISL